jgi:hypothetical protein
MSEAYAAHVSEWLTAEPEMRLAQLFLAQARDAEVQRVEAIGHALWSAAFEVRDARVAQAKLAWWVEELSQSTGRHPLTRDASGDPRRRAGLRDAALSLLALSTRESIESTAQLMQPLQAFSSGMLRARDSDPALATALGGARLCSLLRHWTMLARAERAWLPLDLLARHRADRAAAADPTDVRGQAVLGDLLQSAADTWDGIGGTALRGIDGARIAVARVWHRHLYSRTAPAVAGTLSPPRWSLVLALWRVGRRSAGVERHGVGE